MEFYSACMAVDDVDKAMTFYEKAFSCKRFFLHEAGDYGEVKMGNITIGFVKEGLIEKHINIHRSRPTDEKVPAMMLSFTDEDPDTIFNHAVANGATVVVPPTDMPWGQRCATVRDINGFAVEIGTPMIPSN